MFDLQTHLLPTSKQEYAPLGHSHGLRRRAAGQRRWKPSRPIISRKPSSIARFSITCCTMRLARKIRRSRRSIWCSIPLPSRRKLLLSSGAIRFTTSKGAYQNLMTLSQERIRFLSTRRCRHFLASIAPRLLPAIAATPDPDQTLVNLSKVSDSLGGKGVLWELFSFNPPSLHLYVELCASSPYLSSILDQQPRHDRRADGQPGARQAAQARNAGSQSRRSCPRRGRSRPDFAQLQKRASACALACAIFWARKISSPRAPRWPISPKFACG